MIAFFGVFGTYTREYHTKSHARVTLKKSHVRVTRESITQSHTQESHLKVTRESITQIQMRKSHL